jgi:glycosyltransferase involved in cell wall biosynthesis
VRIGVDIHPVLADVTGRVEGAVTRTGVGNYTFHVLRELLELDRENEYRLVALRGRLAPRPFELGRNGRYRFVRFPPEKVYTNLVRYRVPVPFDLLAGRADVFLFPNFVRYPLLFTRRSVVVVYDVSFALFPEHAARRSQTFLARQVPLALERATRVVTISESSKRDLATHFSVPEAKITVAEPAVDRERFRPASADEVAAARDRYGLPERYILFVGTLEPRKNLSLLLRAYDLLPEDLRARHPLVLAGGRGWIDEETARAVDRLQAAGRVVAPGYVHDEHLPAIYTGASLFAFPSLYEGWGIPVLEAMACGTPVVASSSSSLPEAAGDAARLVDPHDADALARELQSVLEDQDLRAALVERGHAQAARFSWRRSAQRVLETLEAAAR